MYKFRHNNPQGYGGLFYKPARFYGGQLVDISHAREGDLTTNAYRPTKNFNEQLQAFIRDIPAPQLQGNTKADRDKYREDSNAYNKYVKDKEKEFMGYYRDEILSNVEQRFIDAGYTKDKNGVWRKPASLEDLPWLNKIAKHIPGFTDFANNAISTGERFYNKPNLDNAVALGQTAVNAWNTGTQLGTQLANPKQLVKDIAISKGKEMLGMGFKIKDFTKLHNHYKGYRMNPVHRIKGRGWNNDKGVWEYNEEEDDQGGTNDLKPMLEGMVQYLEEPKTLNETDKTALETLTADINKLLKKSLPVIDDFSFIEELSKSPKKFFDKFGDDFKEYLTDEEQEVLGKKLNELQGYIDVVKEDIRDKTEQELEAELEAKHSNDIWISNDINDINERKKYMKSTKVSGTQYEAFTQEEINTSADKIRILSSSLSAKNPNINNDEKYELVWKSKNIDLANEPEFAKYISVDAIDLKFNQQDNIEEITLVEIKNYYYTLGEITDAHYFDVNTKQYKYILDGDRKERLKYKNHFEKELRDNGISEDVIKKTFEILPVIQKAKFSGSHYYFKIREDNDKWEILSGQNPVNVKYIKNNKNISTPLNSIDKYLLEILDNTGKIRNYNMKTLADNICDKVGGYYKVKEEYLLSSLKPNRDMFIDKTGKRNIPLFNKALDLYNRKYKFIKEKDHDKYCYIK